MRGVQAIGRKRVFVSCAAAALAVVLTAAAPALGSARSANWHVIKNFTTHNTNLADIVGFSDGTAWAGGETPAQTPVLYHLTGKKWHAVALTGPTGSFVVNLSATSPSNVWAALANEPAVAHLKGSGWVVKSFTQGTDDIAAGDVQTIGPKNTWVFAYDFTTQHPFAEHFNGSRWTRSSLPALVDCDCSAHATSASGPNNMWAWVFDSKIKGFATMHWNGHRWQVVKLPPHVVPAGQNVGAQQMLAESPSDVWATADNSMSTGSVILLHWNGRAWGKIGGKLPKGQLAGPIASDGNGGLWLVGRTPAFTYFILRYANRHWTRFPMPSDPSGAVTPNAIRLITGTKSVLGVGNLSPSIAGDNGSAVMEFGR